MLALLTLSQKGFSVANGPVELIIVTKLSVLLIFSQANRFLTPDEVCRKLQPSPDRRSLYSYLARLKSLSRNSL
jgi:hypothetical protein